MNHEHAAKTLTLTVLILIFTLVGILTIFIRTLEGYAQRLSYSTEHTEMRSWHSTLLRAVPAEVSSVDSWMTFSYLERAFRLPPGYLAERLPAIDPHYPRLTIKKYAASHGLSVTSTLANVKVSISTFIASGTPSSTVWK